MRRSSFVSVATVAATFGFAACGSDDSGETGGGPSGGSDGATGGSGEVTGSEVTVTASYAANGCAAAKQIGAGAYCRNVLGAWAAWETTQDDAMREARIEEARQILDDEWTAAEEAALDGGANCSDGAMTAEEAVEAVDSALTGVVEAVNSGLDDAACGAAILDAAAAACDDALVAEGRHIADLAADADGATVEADKAAASDALSTAYDDATADGCGTDATVDDVLDAVGSAVDAIVDGTIVAANLDDTEFTLISPTGTTSYLGKDLTPVCMDGSPYHFWGKRGTVNKLLVYYQGGGACWEDLTCSLQVCKTQVDPVGENPANFDSGFADRSNPDNPFRDWHQLIVSYCSCDIHFGDALQEYPTRVEHRGFHNSQIAEKWAREHFLEPEEVFVTGTSAGSYGALFNGALLHEVWPTAQFHVLGDAGNGVITTEFLNDELSNWNFIQNLPDDVPGVLESLQGGGMVSYIEAVAKHYSATNWAHYSTAFDGGSGGQTGFYNVMLNANDPIAALSWWEGSCAFNTVMRQQAIDTFAQAGENYRYYIGTGSRHGMFGADKVYDDTTGGVPTVVDWINAMMRSGPDGRDPEWTNVECQNCGLLLPGDPAPDPVEPPFEQQGSDTLVVCP